HGLSGIDTAGDGGDMIDDRVADHRARLHQPVDREPECHPAAGNGGAARAAVSLDHVAVHDDLAFAERHTVHAGAEGAADEPLDLLRAAGLLAGRSLAAVSRVRRARQHTVFGRYPTEAGSLQERWRLFLDRRGAEDMGVAAPDEARSLGVLGDAGLDLDGTHGIKFPAGGSHGASFRACRANYRPAAGGGNPGLTPVPADPYLWEAMPERDMQNRSKLLDEMNDRSREVFRRVVESYLDTGDPVGSRTLSRTMSEPVSAATIRNVMQDLEFLGLLDSPHTSAGRVPTQLGLRMFVDGLMEVSSVSLKDREAIDATTGGNEPGIAPMLDRIGAALSGITHGASLVLAPKHEAAIRHIEFVGLGPDRALVVLVFDDGHVENRVFTPPLGHTQSSL